MAKKNKKSQKAEPVVEQPKKSGNKLFTILIVLCIVSLLPSGLWHGHFGFDDWYGFPAVLGFVSFVALLLVGRFLGHLLSVKEDFYDDE